MGVYRVRGSDRETNEARSLKVEADSLVQALTYGEAEGLYKVDGELISGSSGLSPDETDSESEPVVKIPRGSSPRPHLVDLDSSLLRSPVWTIAKGVAAGLFLHTAIIIVVLLVVSAVTGGAIWSISR